jgi:hypothetical protein
MTLHHHMMAELQQLLVLIGMAEGWLEARRMAQWIGIPGLLEYRETVSTSADSIKPRTAPLGDETRWRASSYCCERQWQVRQRIGGFVSRLMNAFSSSAKYLDVRTNYRKTLLL